MDAPRKKLIYLFTVIVALVAISLFANLEYIDGLQLSKTKEMKISITKMPQSKDSLQMMPLPSDKDPSQSSSELDQMTSPELLEMHSSTPSQSPTDPLLKSVSSTSSLSQSPSSTPSQSPSTTPSHSSTSTPTQSPTSDPTHGQPLSPRRCLSLSEEIDELVQQSKQVYIVMLPKAAGSTAEHFARACTDDPKIMGNFLNWEDRLETFFTHTLEMPSIVAAHLYVGDKTLGRIIKQTTRDDLIIYVHREETDRVMSAVKMVVEDWLCGGKAKKKASTAKIINKHPELYRLEEGKGSSGNKNTLKKCTVSEKALVNTVIKNRLMELTLGVHKVLTCDAYKTIEDHAPNMIFVDYRQMDKLQYVLAKHRCPNLIPNLPLQVNVSAEKKAFDIRIELQNKNDNVKEVAFPEWLDAKRELMEWALKIKKGPQCLAKTRIIENDLDLCRDKILQVSSSSFSTFQSNV